MKNITVKIKNDKEKKLRKKGKNIGVDFEQFISATIEDLADRPDPKLTNAVKKIIDKNSELYQKL